MEQQPITQQSVKNYYNGHYHGRLVRALLVTAALIMAVSLPVFNSLVALPLHVSLFAIIALLLMGGIINPISKWVFLFSSILPIPGFVIFESYAFQAFQTLSFNVPINIAYFWTNQVLALLFFFATYLSVRTLRSMIQSKFLN